MAFSGIYEWRLGSDFMSISKGPNAVIKINNTIYLFTDYEKKNNICYKAEILSDDTLSSFTAINLDIFTNNQRSSYIATEKRIYEIGGEINGTITNNISYFPILSNGKIGKQKRSRNFITPISRAALVYLNNCIYVIGGLIDNNVLSNCIYVMELNENHSIKKTYKSIILNEHLSDATALVYKKNIYVFGGKNGLYSTNKVFRITFDDENKPKIIDQVPLPERLTRPACVILGDKVYVIGYKSDNSLLRKTYTAFFDPYGNLDNWVEDLSIPYNIDELVAVNNNTSFFLIGGLYGNEKERLVLYPNFNRRTVDRNVLDFKDKEKIKLQIKILNFAMLIIIALIIYFFIFLEIN